MYFDHYGLHICYKIYIIVYAQHYLSVVPSEVNYVWAVPVCHTWCQEPHLGFAP